MIFSLCFNASSVSGTRNGSVEITTDDQTFTCSAGHILPDFCADDDDSTTTTTTTTTSNPINPVLPTTPSPTNPQSVLQCDDSLEGDYNGDLVTVDVYIPFDGDIAFTVSINNESSDLIVLIRDGSGTIIAADGDSGDADGQSDGVRVIEGLSAGNYTVEFVSSTESAGTFVVGLECTTLEPTATSTPSPVPITTPSPTQPTDIVSPIDVDGGELVGPYNNESVVITVDIPYECNVAVFDGTGNATDLDDVRLTVRDNASAIVAVDGDSVDEDGAANGVVVISGLAPGIYTVTLSAGNGQFGTFDFDVMCSSDAPSASPTTPAPTEPAEAIECGDDEAVTGQFNGELLTFAVTVDAETNLEFVVLIDDDVPRSILPL